MAVAFLRGQQLGRQDLNIFLTNSAGTPTNAAEITYAIVDFTTGQEVVVGVPRMTPANPSVGEYYVSLVIPLDANLGDYRVRWSFRELVGSPLVQVVQEFEVIARQGEHDGHDEEEHRRRHHHGGPCNCPDRHHHDRHKFTIVERDLIRRIRTLLRDNDPDRNYHFRPPSMESTVRQFSQVFGFIWEDDELHEFILRSLDMIIAAPPRTPFANVDHMVRSRAEWRTLLLTGAMIHALQAVRINWIADEFDYSIGGISLNLDKAGKYEAAYQAQADQFDKQLEKAKATVNFVRGLQQPRFGVGIRSAFGPYVGAGVLTPRKFVGF